MIITNYEMLLNEQKKVIDTLNVQDGINVQEEKFLKNIKRVGHNRRAGGNFFSKSINVQTKIKPCRVDFLSGKSLNVHRT